ncbi:MAG TPA: ParB N-terminal domain-containing protein [Trichocoleus sp.]
MVDRTQALGSSWGDANIARMMAAAGVAAQQHTTVDEVATLNDSDIAESIMVNPAEVLDSEEQYRLFIEREELDSLVAKIKQFGFLGSIWAYRDAEGRLRNLSGARRAQAAAIAGIPKIRADVIKPTSLNQIAEIGYQANNQAKGLNLIEDTLAVLRILSINLKIEQDEVISLLYKINNKRASELETRQVSEIFDRVFDSITISSFVRTRLPLLKLPQDVLEPAIKGQINGNSAMRIAKIPDEAQRRALITEAIAKRLSVREIEARVAELLPEKTPKERAEIVETFRYIGKRIETVTDSDKQRKIEEKLLEIQAIIDE